MLDTELRPLTETTVSPVRALPAESENRQRRRMVLALVLLLAALGLVLVKDRDFWFPAQTAADSEVDEDLAAAATTEPQTAVSTAPHTALAASRSRKHQAAPEAPPAPSNVPVVTSRAVLPPLEIEVVAGDQPQHPLRSSSAPVNLNLQDGSHPPTQPKATNQLASVAPGPLTRANERIRMANDAVPALSRQVQPEYPLLARQMKVQGSVVLQAMVGKDGGIQDLKVVTGPSILAGAAREAVKQWRFKPYMQGGQPVDTQTQITVNFAISTN